MAEYIEREDAIKELTGWETDPTDEEIELVLRRIPTADVVEVVRCKDCIHAHLTYGGEAVKYCIKCSDEAVYFDADHFCAFGERREK